MQLKPLVVNFIADMPYRQRFPDFPTGIIKIDETCWFRRKNLNVIAARPSQNKSTFALNALAVPTAEAGKTVLYFTLEDRYERMSVRYLANKTSIVNKLIAENKLAEHQLEALYAHRDALKDLPLHIVEDVGYEVSEIENFINKNQLKPDLIIVDYLSRIRVPQGYENKQAVDKYLAEFSNLSKKLDFCAVALCQINREAQGHGNNKDIGYPQLHHLRESGRIEEMADLVLMLHWKYKYTNDELMDKSVIEVLISKNKDGDVGLVRCRISPEYNRIENAQ